MKISSVRIEKFRSFEDAIIPLNDYACLLVPMALGNRTSSPLSTSFFVNPKNLPTDLSQLDSRGFSLQIHQRSHSNYSRFH